MGWQVSLNSAVSCPGLWSFSVVGIKVGHKVWILSTVVATSHFIQVLLKLLLTFCIENISKLANKMLPVGLLDLVVV